MKTKSLVSLVAVLSLTPAVVLRAQEQPAPVAVQPAQAGVEKAWAKADEARAQADAEFKKAQGQLDHAQKLIDEQVLQVDSLPSGFSQRLVRLGPSRGATRTLVIRSSESAPAQPQANLEEDLAVMSHILTKAVEEKFGGTPHAANVLGIDVSFGPGSSAVRSLYLEGYGALFVLSVDFPLLPPLAGNAQKEKTETDSTWEAARQELYGTRAEEGVGAGSYEAYDEEKVSKLKTTLLESVKDATNIRGLKPEDVVTICVAGGPAVGKIWHKVSTAGSGGGGVSFRSPATRQSILTLRAKKSDIDAFAKGKLGLDDFQKRAQIATYPGSAGGVGSMSFGGGGGGSGTFGGFGGGGGGQGTVR